ncbi:MAG: pyridoxal phosphate-dependent aminotransferase [Mailhella sp.]|nr:pyridoxal phosphate-dependent aminotransferase [Mailhella sp.]
MKFAARMNSVKPSATLAVSAKATELADKGIDIISFALGEPDFDTPKHIGEAAKKAVDDGFTHYTAVPGTAALRKAICAYFQREHNASAKPENVIACAGGKHALFNLLLTMVDPGDEVLIPAPYWTSYPDMVGLAGGTPVIVPCPSSRGFRLTPEDLESKRTASTRFLILNSPSNPTGVAYTQAEIDALIGWAVEHDIFVIADEIYSQLVYPPAAAGSAVSWWERCPEQVAVMNGLSKSFAMTGWRMGFILADARLIKKISTTQSQSTSCISTITQKAAEAALSGSYDCISPMREAFARRRDLAHAEICSWPGVVCPKPEGAFYLFPDVSALFGSKFSSASEMCTYLLEEAHVALVPGEAFGDPSCVRLSYALSDDRIMEGLARVKKALFA